MVTIEAMLCEKPVICYWKYGQYADPPIVNADMSNFKQKIIELIEKPKLRRLLGRKGKEWVIKNHNAEEIVKKLIKIYESLI